MSGDLREKLKALAGDWEGRAQDNLDNLPHGSREVAAHYLDRASELRDLLASHEEREGGPDEDLRVALSVLNSYDMYEEAEKLESRIGSPVQPEEES